MKHRNGVMLVEDWLKKKGWRQMDLAREVGITKGALSSIIAGRTAPRVDTYRRIFLATDGEVTPNDILRVSEWRDELAAESE